jgi:Fe-S cluster assembly scaffold protein SufB
MTAKTDVAEQLYRSVGQNLHELCADPDVAHVEIHHNKVLGTHLVPGLEVEAREQQDGIEAVIHVEKNARISRPIRICFGMMPATGLQQIKMRLEIEENASAGILAYCTFPNAQDIRHEMDAELFIGRNAQYAYLERHVHGPAGGVKVIPYSHVHVAEGARYRTDFELIKGRAGEVDIDMRATCAAHSVTELLARISGSHDDRIVINETAELTGDSARGVLTTMIALRDDARAEVRNTLTATAARARGHVDCKEIIRDRAQARAIPIVDVQHPTAHVTHEAAIGSVDSKQLQTLMIRGLNEDDATDMIIQGLLS